MHVGVWVQTLPLEAPGGPGLPAERGELPAAVGPITGAWVWQGSARRGWSAELAGRPGGEMPLMPEQQQRSAEVAGLRQRLRQRAEGQCWSLKPPACVLSVLGVTRHRFPGVWRILSHFCMGTALVVLLCMGRAAQLGHVLGWFLLLPLTHWL